MITVDTHYQPPLADGPRPSEVLEDKVEGDPARVSLRVQEAYRDALAQDDEAGIIEALLKLAQSAFYHASFFAALTFAEEALGRAQGHSDALQAQAYLRFGSALIDVERYVEAA